MSFYRRWYSCRLIEDGPVVADSQYRATAATAVAVVLAAISLVGAISAVSRPVLGAVSYDCTLQAVTDVKTLQILVCSNIFFSADFTHISDIEPDTTQVMKRVAVIGAGVIGLPCAYRLLTELSGLEVSR